MNFFVQKDCIGCYALDNSHSTKILSCNWFVNPEKFGIPLDIVIKIYNDHNQLKIKKDLHLDSSLKVVYIEDDENDNELQNSLNIISIFNQINSVDLFIYCNEKNIEIFRGYSNDDIQYIQKSADTNKKTPLEADVIITYGPGVLHFIKQLIPVIIIGPYGLGGWVTPDNFPYLLKSGFVGRAGGTFGEYIPAEIIAHELLTIKENKNLSSILNANKAYADSLHYKPISAANAIIAEATELQEKINHSQKRWKLYPIVASNILFEECNGTVAIKRKHIHDTLCTVSKEDVAFFNSIDGKTDCKTLFKVSEMEEDDFWETIYSLNERKIILF